MIVDKEPGDPVEIYENKSKYTHAIIDSLEEGLMVIDRNFVVIDINKALLSKQGHSSKKKVIGKYCFEISHDMSEICDFINHECPIKTILETGEAKRVTHIHKYYGKGRKQERYIDVTASPITDKQGNINLFVLLMRDITEIKKTELTAIRAHQDLTALNDIGLAVSQSLDLDIVLSSALDKTLEIMQRSSGGILLIDDEKQTLSYRIHRGLSDRYAREMVFKLGVGIVGKAASTGKAILVEDISTDIRAIRPDILAAERLRAFACVPLRSKGKVLGILSIASHDPGKFSSEDVRFLNSVAAQIAIAIENSRLHQEVRYKEEIRGELLHDIITLQEEERKRIARELHDETSQVLASLTASLEAASSLLTSDTDKARTMITKAQALSVSILDEINNLVYELRPTLLDDLGLVAAVRSLIENILPTENLAVNFKTTRRMSRLVPQLETALFRVTQEALYNISKHAHARNADISLYFRKKSVKLQVRDDGWGFNVEEAINSKNRPRGLGLLGMKERIESLNGTLNILSHPGGGTEISIEIPLDEEVVSGQD